MSHILQMYVLSITNVCPIHPIHFTNYCTRGPPFRTLFLERCSWWRTHEPWPSMYPEQLRWRERAEGWHCQCARSCMCRMAGVPQGGERTSKR